MPVPDELEFARRTDPYRRELLVHCYRMLGSFHDAEDVVQETFLRAWRAYERFEERSSIRTWLYRIATRACLTALESKGRRVLPSGLGAASEDPHAPLAARRPEVSDDPATIAARRESTRLAFVAALQELPARQRAALVLRDVLAWPAADVADLLGLSTAAVNSALQRARATMARARPTEETITMTPDIDEDVVARFVTAFQTADIAGLTALLRHDVELEMPPIPTWFTGRDAVVGFFAHRALAGAARRLVRTRANGCPAVATYTLGADGGYHAHSIQVLETEGAEITHVYAFLDTDLFEVFTLPLVLPR
jgi:RNA polymerase sigma-70 factor (ECF subfamily)